MINITNRKQKIRLHNFIIKKQDRNEISFRNLTKQILRKQWRNAIDDIESGNTNINYNINKYTIDLLNVFRNQYKLISKEYFDFTFDFIEENKSYVFYEKKDTENIFQTTIDRWIETEALKEVVSIINPNTIKAIKLIIKKGIDDGKSYSEIASDMKKAESSINSVRAAMIARTEVHNAFAKTVDETIKASGLRISLKEWASFIDDRTRISHVNVGGTRVEMKEFFLVGSDKMLYPGDSANGGPDNLIRCRCILFYYT